MILKQYIILLFVFCIVFILITTGCEEEKNLSKGDNEVVTSREAGESCNADYDCKSNKCLNDLCTNEIGNECKDDNNCTSGICINSICAECKENKHCTNEMVCYETKCREHCASGNILHNVCLPKQPALLGLEAAEDGCSILADYHCSQNQIGEGSICINLPELNNIHCVKKIKSELLLHGSSVAENDCVELDFNYECEDQMPVFGENNCVQTGPACPEFDFHDEDFILNQLGQGDVFIFYVKPGIEEGDGSRLLPFSSINQALNAVEDSAVIVLAKGHYKSISLLNHNYQSLTIMGSCVKETVLSSNYNSGSAAVLDFNNINNVRISNLTLNSESVIGIKIHGSSRNVTLNNINVKNADGVGVFATDTVEVSLLNVQILDTKKGSAANGYEGIGLLTFLGAQVVLENAYIYNSQAAGITVNSAYNIDLPKPAKINIKNVVIAKTKGEGNSEDSGYGIGVFGGANAIIDKIFLYENRSAGIIAESDNSYINKDSTSLEISDILVMNTQSQLANDENGHGIRFNSGSIGKVTRGVLINNIEAGIYLDSANARSYQASTRVYLEDISVFNTKSDESDCEDGMGITVYDSAELEAKNIYLKENSFAGIYVDSENSREGFAPTTVDIRDIAVVDTLSQGCTKDYGVGLAIVDGSNAYIERAYVARNRAVGIFADSELAQSISTPTKIYLTDVAIIDTKSHEIDDEYGIGIAVIDGALVEGKYIYLSGNKGEAIHVTTMSVNENVGQSVLNLTDLCAENTLEKDCKQSNCQNAASGVGLGVYSNSIVQVENFVIKNNALAGLQICNEAFINSKDGLIYKNTIGINIQVEDYSIEDSFENIQVFENSTNFDSVNLAIPKAPKG